MNHVARLAALLLLFAPRARLGDDPTAPEIRVSVATSRGGGSLSATMAW